MVYRKNYRKNYRKVAEAPKKLLAHYTELLTRLHGTYNGLAPIKYQVYFFTRFRTSPWRT